MFGNMIYSSIKVQATSFEIYITHNTVIPRFMSFRLTSNSSLRHFSRGRFSLANVISSDVTLLIYVTHVIIKGREINTLTRKVQTS